MDYSKDMQVAGKHMEPIPLAIRKMQIKSTMRGFWFLIWHKRSLEVFSS